MDLITPYVERGRPIYPYFQVARTPEAIFEYWLIISEIEASTSWKMTRLIASAGEYAQALDRMQSPQIVRALVASFLPEVDIRAIDKIDRYPDPLATEAHVRTLLRN